MANKIKIKSGSAAPTTSNIEDREIAYSRTNKQLYINDNGVVTPVSPEQVNADWNSTSGDSQILNKPDIPSATSQLTNNSGYITAEDIPSIPSATSDLVNDSDFVTSEDIPSATSQLINDSDFLSVGQIYGLPSGGSAGQVLSKVNATDYNVTWTTPVTGGSEAQVQSDWNQTNSSEVDFIKNKPEIPSTTSDLVNDSEFITSGGASATYVIKEVGKELSTNDFTDDLKNKLDGIASGAESNVNADWNAVSGDALILNKPTIPTNSDFTLAGLSEKSYNSLTNKPTIPSKTSDLTNDSGFTTASAVASGYVAKDGSKVLSDNNYDSTSKSKLDGLANITTIGDNLTLTDGTLAAAGGGGGSSIAWHIIDSNTTATAYHGYFIDASTSAVELTLPESFTLGDTIPIRVLDATNVITLKRNGNNIEGEAEDLVVDINRSGFYLVASDAANGWLITTEISAGGSSTTKTPLTSDVVLTVGSGGTYATITSALNYLLNSKYPANGYTATIQLLAGFVMEEQVWLDGVDASWITLTSVDATVTIDRSSLTEQFYGWLYPAFVADNRAYLPIIDVLFEMNTTTAAGSNAGIFVARGAGCRVLPTCGIKDVVNGWGFIALSGSAELNGAVFTGSSSSLSAYYNANINFYGGNATGYTSSGVTAAQNALVNFYEGNARKAGSDTSSDLAVFDGGILCARSALGGVNQTANTITSGGIIFK